MTLHEASHPLIAHKMTLLRDAKTSTKEFRQLIREITFFLGYEATTTLERKYKQVTTPMNVTYAGSKIGQTVAIIPILRAGLGMSDGMSELIPSAAVHHIGMYRSKDSLLPIQYYNKLPKDKAVDIAFVCDPCIATSNTINAVCNIIKRWGAKKIVVIACIAARAGIDNLIAKHPDVDIYIGAIDETLSAEGMIMPGIGDAGDRQFGTVDEIPDMLPDCASPDTNKRSRK